MNARDYSASPIRDMDAPPVDLAAMEYEARIEDALLDQKLDSQEFRKLIDAELDLAAEEMGASSLIASCTRRALRIEDGKQSEDYAAVGAAFCGLIDWIRERVAHKTVEAMYD